MLAPVLYNPNDQTPIYKQIASAIARQIQKGELVKNDVLPSINSFSENYSVARDTAQKAYNHLKTAGYVGAFAGKSYFVIGKKESRLKILLVFNKLSVCKKIVYYSFLKSLGDKASVDFHIHHNCPKELERILEAGIGKYDHYVVIPHFAAHVIPGTYIEILNRIPPGKLLLLDKSLMELPGASAVYQEFRSDIFKGLESAVDVLTKYDTIAILFPTQGHYPPEIVEGLSAFCKCYKKNLKVSPNVGSLALKPGTVYIAIEDDVLADLIENVRKSSYTLGKEIGIISFNESRFKELLDITVISTDFEKMGQKAASMILKKQNKQVKNPFKLIKRGSI